MGVVDPELGEVVRLLSCSGESCSDASGMLGVEEECECASLVGEDDGDCGLLVVEAGDGDDFECTKAVFVGDLLPASVRDALDKKKIVG